VEKFPVKLLAGMVPMMVDEVSKYDEEKHAKSPHVFRNPSSLQGAIVFAGEMQNTFDTKKMMQKILIR